MPAKIQLSKEQINEMLRLKTKEKMSYETIGKIFGVSAQTVSRQLKLLDIDPVALSMKYKYDEYYFHNIDTTEKAYWLGFITADGYLNEERRHFHFHLGWKDREHLEKFLQAIHGEMKVKQEVHSLTGNFIATLNIDGTQFSEDLVKNGVRQKKSAKEKPPTTIPDKFIRDYIRGLFDGDGCIFGHRIDLRSSYDMCKWVQEILIKECNIPKTKIMFDSNIYRIAVSKGFLKVLKWLYNSGCSNSSLQRKYEHARLILLKNKWLKSFKTAV